jgi:hypothetical protein
MKLFNNKLLTKIDCNKITLLILLVILILLIVFMTTNTRESFVCRTNRKVPIDPTLRNFVSTTCNNLSNSRVKCKRKSYCEWNQPKNPLSQKLNHSLRQHVDKMKKPGYKFGYTLDDLKKIDESVSNVTPQVNGVSNVTPQVLGVEAPSSPPETSVAGWGRGGVIEVGTQDVEAAAVARTAARRRGRGGAAVRVGRRAGGVRLPDPNQFNPAKIREDLSKPAATILINEKKGRFYTFFPSQSENNMNMLPSDEYYTISGHDRRSYRGIYYLFVTSEPYAINNSGFIDMVLLDLSNYPIRLIGEKTVKWTPPSPSQTEPADQGGWGVPVPLQIKNLWLNDTNLRRQSSIEVKIDGLDPGHNWILAEGKYN